MLNSSLAPTVKYCFLVLAEFADADGGNCFPSIPMMARIASVNERTVRRSMDELERNGFFRRVESGTKHGWRRYTYVPNIPEGADTRPARQVVGAGKESTPMGGTCGLSVQNVRTLSPERAGTESAEVSITHPLPMEELTPTDRFDEFWKLYPRKEGKAKAARVWKSRRLDNLADLILKDVAARVSDRTMWADPKYIPHPTTYLNQRRWEDEWRPARPGSAADSFHEANYTGTPLSELPDYLRPAA